MPKRTERTVTRIEWQIGDEDASDATARTLTDGLYFAEKEMKEMGIQPTDDMYHWRSGDGATIVLWVEVET